MPSIQIADFKAGMDRRRERVAGVPGTLWVGKNCHITRGGDVERMKDFVAAYALPANTFGLEQINGQLFVFGSADLAASVPNGTQYQRLQAADAGSAMVRVLMSTLFDGKTYVIAEYANGHLHHFYNGTRVSALDTLAASAASYTTLADYMARKIDASGVVHTVAFGAAILVTARVPGTAFTLTAATVDGGGNNDQTMTVTTVQANVAEVAEVRATGTVTITGGTRDPGINRIAQVTVNGVDLLDVAVDWITSNNATATAVAVGINNATSRHGFSASAAGAVVTIQAEPGTGATPNGKVVAVDVDGDVTASTANMSGGVTYVAPVAQISRINFGGTFQAADKFTATLNGVDYVATGQASAHGTYAFVHKSRVWTTAGSLFRGCKLNDPTDWTNGDASTGAVAINIASDTRGNQRALAAEVYLNSVAVFGRNTIPIYNLFADAANNELDRVLENAGTPAPRSVTAHGDLNIIYLGDSGIRSIMVRDTIGNAYVSDNGTPIDTFVLDWMAALTAEKVSRAVATIEPVDGRYWLAIDDRVFVLSYFPYAKINAWSYYDLGFVITDFAKVDRRIYARDEDTIYLYGGTTGSEYPDDETLLPVVETPFYAVKSPAEFKNWTGFDVACTGTWNVEMLLDPRDDTKKVTIGRVTGPTYNMGSVEAIGESPVFALRLTGESSGRATVSALQVHYESGDSEE